MEKIPAANLKSLFQVSHDVFEPIGIEWLRIQKKSQMADNVAGSVTGEDGVGIHGLQDLRGVVGKDQLKQIAEAGKVVDMVTKKGGGTCAPGELLGSGLAGEPMAFVEDGEDIGGAVAVGGRLVLGDVVVRRHGVSLARMEGRVRTTVGR